MQNHGTMHSHTDALSLMHTHVHACTHRSVLMLSSYKIIKEYKNSSLSERSLISKLPIIGERISFMYSEHFLLDSSSISAFLFVCVLVCIFVCVCMCV